MRVAHVAGEIAPWCATGGLGQVMGALPDALAERHIDVDAFFPLCRRARQELELTVVEDFGDWRLVTAADRSAAMYFIDAPQYFDRSSLYGEHGSPYADDAERFAFFNKAVISAWATTGRPDIAHVHDWHAAILPAFLAAEAGRPATVLTIHNVAYQGVFAPDAVPGIDPSDGALNFLGSGIATADVVATVSPTYAEELVTDGAGLEPLLAARAPLVGILNGIDVAEWNPSDDDHIPSGFSSDDISAKGAARQALTDHFGLDAGPTDLVASVVSRLVEQKGIDLIIEAAPGLFAQGIRLVVVGDGDPALEAALTDLAAAHPGKLGVHIGWNVGLAHLVTAGSDAVVIPSRFEPCGLTQMQAMRYGTVPVVHAVGGLADTVSDPGDDGLLAGRGTGFSFSSASAAALTEALTRAASLHRLHRDAWDKLAQSIMAIDWSWGRATEGYADLYRQLVAH